MPGPYKPRTGRFSWSAMASILGVDVGGTFTDLLLLEDGRLRTFKRPSTPADPARAVVAGIAEMGATPEEVVHGSTIATNVLLERRGARAGLITTKGFRDVLEIGRQTRPKLYDLEPRRPEPLVPRERRYELNERIDAQGHVLTIPSAGEIESLLDRLLVDGVESLAVCLLFSYLNPAHERQIAAAARRRGLSISVSSELVPEYREYERTSTTVMNAYLAPAVADYLQHLKRDLHDSGTRRLRIVQSDGGSASVETLAARPLAMALSGPAAGVNGAFAAGRLAGFDHVITFDMGGTSTDVALCPGRVAERQEIEIGGLPARLTAVDVHTVGAGGGSLARIDAGGALRVGPESAGAEPGPACYGRGMQPAVTDAQLVLGRLIPAHFLGGRMRLFPEGSRTALASLGGDPVKQAGAVLRVVNANMERAIRVVSVERGHDPRDFTLVAFGGAGPLHACELAAALRIPRVLVPPFPGVLSAFGMLAAPMTRTYQHPVMRALSPDTEAEVGELLRRLVTEIKDKGRRELIAEGYDRHTLTGEASLDMRYAGQSYEISVPLVAPDSPGLITAFHEQHRKRYGHADPNREVEIVNLRYRAIAPGHEPALQRLTARPGGTERARLHNTPQWYDQWYEAPVYNRELLAPGDHLSGPAVIVQMDTTTALPPGWQAEVDVLGNLVLTA